MDAGAWIVVAAGTAAERQVPVHGRLLVGRECRGAEPSRCLIIEEPSVSRDHLEIRFDPSRGSQLVDLSTNGTLVNGRRVERGESIPLSDGDLIELGAVQLAFRAPAASHGTDEHLRTTIRAAGATRVAIVVGDIVGYTAITESRGGVAVAEAAEALFAALRDLIAGHRGTVSNYLGDAIFAAWDADRDPGAPVAALEFALAAHELVTTRAPTLSIRDADGGALRMGWAVTFGEAGVARPSPGREAIHGDAVNLAFRLAGLAARDGNAPILVSEGAAALAPATARYGGVEEIYAKGRTEVARVRSAERA